jgi:cardiolipin synthase
MRRSCNEITVASLGELKGWPLVQSFLAYHFTRRYPRWASWLPRHVPRLLPAAPDRGKPLAPAFAGFKEKA